MPSRTLMSATAIAALVCGLAGQASAQDMIVGLITKTDTNPFFVKMKEGAEAQARESGMELRSYAGRYDGDNETQVEAIESLIAAGAKGILLTPSDSAAIVPTVQKARDAGILVIALDTQLEPSDAADATFATDNFRAGELIGEWAAATLGDEAANARIALLDLSEAGISVDVQRNQGFLTGFGIDVNDPTRMRDEDDPRIVGNDITQGAEEGGRRAMENLLQRDQGINVVYTINEPAAAGAYEALNAFGFAEQALIVSIDGGCPGVQNVRDGIIGATSMQFPLLMASLGIEAIKTYAETGEKPENTEGLDFYNTGVELVTDQPVDGIPSITSEEALEKCWG
jgi:fructose transport system substrate-binding protein